MIPKTQQSKVGMHALMHPRRLQVARTTEGSRPYPFHSPSCHGVTKRRRISTRGNAARAFTLLEVILAVTIAGTLIAGAATIMVAVSNAWMDRQDKHFFEDHVDGVVEFLQASFTAAGSEITFGESEGDSTATDPNTLGNEVETPSVGNITINIPTGDNTDGGGSSNGSTGSTSGSGLMSVSEDPITWTKPPGYADYQDPLINLSLKDTPPLLVQNENAPTVGVKVFLHFDADDGLSLLWYSPLQEDSEDINDLRRTLISDLITAIEYVYWDDSFEKWETETEPKEGEGDEQFILPRFLKLTFEYEGETTERTLTIPVPSRSALIF